ncbi:hypothetical protein AHAS_Ahas13G0342600 [Arachis hypogaea]
MLPAIFNRRYTPLDIVSSSGYHSTPAMMGLRSSMDGDVDMEAAVHCLVPRKNAVDPKVSPVIGGDDAPVDGLTLNGAGVDKGSIRAGSAGDISVENLGNSDGKDLEQEEQMLENRKTWELAIESGAVQYNNEDDIMAILQEQNEALAQKRRLVKQKEKA